RRRRGPRPTGRRAAQARRRRPRRNRAHRRRAARPRPRPALGLLRAGLPVAGHGPGTAGRAGVRIPGRRGGADLRRGDRVLSPPAGIGHSVGEIAAAVTAGAMSVADGARLICRRSRLLRQAEGKGAMVMAGLSFEEAAERLAGRTDLVAAIASAPGSTVLSG